MRVLRDNRVAERKAGRERVDPNTVVAEFPRQRARKRHDAALRRHVVQHPGNALEGRARPDVDDLAIALRDHMRADMLHHEERAAQIDGHDVIPRRRLDLGALLVVQRGEDRGVVDQNIDLAEAVHGLARPAP